MNNQHEMIAPPSSLDPAEYSRRHPSYLTIRRVGKRGLVELRHAVNVTPDELLDEELLVAIRHDLQSAWGRSRGRMRRVDPKAAFQMLSLLLTGDHVLRETLGIPRVDLELPIECCRAVLEGPDDTDWLITMDITGVTPRRIRWPSRCSAARYSVVHLPGRRRVPILSVVNAPCIDALPCVGQSLAVVDNLGDRSMVQYHGKLKRVPREHARWVCAILLDHFHRLARVTRPATEGGGLDGGAPPSGSPDGCGGPAGGSDAGSPPEANS